jgi:hypothetical protein
MPDRAKFYYLLDSQGRYTGRIPIAKTEGHFFRADGSEAAEGEPSDHGLIILFDANGKELQTIHSWPRR